MYDRTGLRTKCTLIQIGFKNLRTGTEAKFRHFVDALEAGFNCPGTYTPGVSQLPKLNSSLTNNRNKIQKHDLKFSILSKVLTMV